VERARDRRLQPLGQYWRCRSKGFSAAEPAGDGIPTLQKRNPQVTPPGADELDAVRSGRNRGKDAAGHPHGGMQMNSIVNNVGAINALNRLTRTNAGLAKTLERLSSGLRINSAADDASGLAIADGLRADVAALNQAARNASDGVSVVQVADGALAEVSNLLQRAVALAEQAASDTSGADSGAAKASLNSEYQEIMREINRISATVDFNGSTLFGTSGFTFDVQVGASGNATNDVITLTTSALTAAGTATGGLGLTGTGSGVTVTTTALNTAATAQTELALVRDAIDEVASRRGDIGAARNRLDSTISVVAVQAQNLTAAESQVRDADIASEIVNLTKFQVLNQTGLSALAQANLTSQAVLSLLR
jgi:flagellin